MRYPPINFCIYCGQHNLTLTDEHVLPKGLGGVHILPKASCEACQKITCKLEDKCLRGMLGEIRSKRNFPTRRKKERPTALPVYLNKETGSPMERIEVPVAEHPTVLFLAKFAPARILYGLPYFEWNKVWSVPWIFGPTSDELLKFAAKHGAKGITGGAFDPGAFARLLAKIALGFAYTEIPRDQLRPLVNDMILGKTTDINHLVGGNLGDPPPADLDHLHRIWPEVKRLGNSTYLIVNIRLFSDLAAPVYHVVVAELIKNRKIVLDGVTVVW